MEIINEEKFIKGVESLIDPMGVSNLLFYQKLKRILPSFALKKLLHNASKKNPYIGFVIEPYSLFLFFKLKDIEQAKAMLPDRYELSKTKLFADDEPEFYMGMGNLSTRASTFWGVRQECYLIARDKETGLLCWIFIDLLSNTLIALPAKGVADPNSKNAVFTTTSKGEIYLDLRENKTNRHFQLSGTITNGTMRELDEEIWVMGNTSIGHCRRFAEGGDMPFAVIFDPSEVERALDIPTSDITISENTLFPGLADPEPCTVLCFPYAQHYIADSPGCRTYIRNKSELVEHYNKLAESEKFTTFSARTIVKQLWMGFGVSLLVVLLLSIVF